MLSYATARLIVLTAETPAGKPVHIIRARLLCAEARYLKERAASAVQCAQRLRASCAASWMRRFTSADPLGPTMVRCAWCGRMRTSDGKLWLMSPAGAQPVMEVVRVSHGMCPLCRKQKWLNGPRQSDALLADACVVRVSGSEKVRVAAVAAEG